MAASHFKSNANTGLAAPDVFYFGNAVGESATCRFSLADELLARNNPVSIVPGPTVINRLDYNRDGTVSVIDQLLSRNNITTAISKLKQITVPSLLAAGGLVPQALDDAITDIARGLTEPERSQLEMSGIQSASSEVAASLQVNRLRPQAIVAGNSGARDDRSPHRQPHAAEIDEELLELLGTRR